MPSGGAHIGMDPGANNTIATPAGMQAIVVDTVHRKQQTQRQLLRQGNQTAAPEVPLDREPVPPPGRKWVVVAAARRAAGKKGCQCSWSQGHDVADLDGDALWFVGLRLVLMKLDGLGFIPIIWVAHGSSGHLCKYLASDLVFADSFITPLQASPAARQQKSAENRRGEQS